jgi:hypothetical protein
MAPNQNGTTDVIFLGAGQTALAFLDAQGWLDFAVILLNLSANGTQALRIVRWILSKVVGDDPVRAAVISRDPEQFYLFAPWKPMDFNELSMPEFVATPIQVADGPIGAFSTTVIDFPVAFERAIKHLVGPVNREHQILGGVPRVHQHGMKRQFFVDEGVVEHLPHMMSLVLPSSPGL